MLKLLGVTRQRDMVTDVCIGYTSYTLQNVIVSSVCAILRMKDVFSNLDMKTDLFSHKELIFRFSFSL